MNDEASPLLGAAQHVSQGTEAEDSTEYTELLPCRANVSLSRTLLYRVSLYLALCAILEAATFLTNIPLSQVLEGIICEKIRRHNSPPDKTLNCGNNDAVQSELSIITGVSATLSLIPGLLCAVPYGYLADRFGHTLIIRLSLLGITLRDAFKLTIYSFPEMFSPRLSWISPVFELIGGGQSVLSAIVFASLTDIVPEQHRSTVFSYLVGSSMVVRIVMATVAARLMEKSAWLPIGIGFASSILAVFVSLVIPEVHKVTRTAEQTEGEEQPLAGKKTMAERLRMHAKQWRNDLGALVSTRNASLLLLMLTLLTTTLGWHAQDVFGQFARKKYGWSWSWSGYMTSSRSIVTAFLMLVLIPSTDYLLSTKLNLTAQRKDLILARSSNFLMATGTMLMGLSWTSAVLVTGAVIESLGGAYNLILRSLIASMAVNIPTGALFNYVAVLETIGSLVAGPLLAVSFNLGIRLGDDWLGLPFVLAGGLFGVASVMLWGVRLP